MKSFELRTKIRKTYYDEDTKTYISFYIGDEANRKHIMDWFDGGVLDYVAGVMEVKHYGQVWIKEEELWNYPLYQWYQISSDTSMKKIIENGESFTLDFSDELVNIFFDSINKVEYTLYMAQKLTDVKEGIEVGMYASIEEYDAIPKQHAIVVKKKDVGEEIVREGLFTFKTLMELDVVENYQFHKERFEVFKRAKDKYFPDKDW